MDSFLGLFDPGSGPPTTCEVWPEDENSPLPPEPQLGNIEYKLKLITPSRLRFQHLVTQMKWRLREGHGEAIYEIGVEDSGMLIGLSDSDMRASLKTLEQMAMKLGATTTVLRERMVDSTRKVTEVLVRKIPDDQHNIEVRVAVMGNADAGKSTLIGVLTQGQLDSGRGSARLNMFRHLHEIQSGRTSSISHEILGFNSKGVVVNYSEAMTAEEICEVSTKLITFLDLAGHRKYFRTTVAGLSGYSPHYIMLVVSGPGGVLGMTEEHLRLTLALNVPFFVVISKVDLVSPEETLKGVEEVLKSTGCRRVPLVVRNEDDVLTAGSNQLSENIVPIFCISSVTGEGLEPLTRFLHVLPPGVSNKEKQRLEQDEPEFQIDETFRVHDVGTVVGGLLTKGVVTEKTNLVIGPLNNGEFLPVTVQSIHRNKAPCRVVHASQSASLCLDRVIPGLRVGMVLLSCNVPSSACYFFQAQVCVLYHSTSIHAGFQTTVHIGNIRQTAVIEGIMACNSMHTNDNAAVLFRFMRHPEYVQVGMRLLFREGVTKGIGKVTQIFPVETSVSGDSSDE